MQGRIINANGGNYIILNDEGLKVQAKASGRLRYVRVDKTSSFNINLNNKSKKLDSKNIKISPKVGDIVIYDNNDGINYITEIKPRFNTLVRPDVANVDQIILIFAAKEPDFSTLLLDMFLVNLKKEDIKPLIIITKLDLLSDDEMNLLKNEMSYYKSIGYEVLFVSNHNLKERKEILSHLENKVSVLSGQTGAGKSSFLNALIPGFELNTQEISKALGRGKHTTREATLYEYNNCLIGDTPGFSKLDLTSIEYLELKDYFIEFKDYLCKFRDCTHEGNIKGCAVCEAVKKGLIKKSRYNNYIKMLNDIKGR